MLNSYARSAESKYQFSTSRLGSGWVRSWADDSMVINNDAGIRGSCLQLHGVSLYFDRAIAGRTLRRKESRDLGIMIVQELGISELEERKILLIAVVVARNRCLVAIVETTSLAATASSSTLKVQPFVWSWCHSLQLVRFIYWNMALQYGFCG
jgi:hypothetical protein